MTDALAAASDPARSALSMLRAAERAGVAFAVLSPGSRSTALVWALAQTNIAVEVVVDERAAAFVALGHSRVSGRPALLICTSGTAGAHYLPALIEAHTSGVPLLALTADRPTTLQHNGSSQTIDQTRLFGAFVHASLTAPTESASPRAEAAAARIGRQAVQLATERRGPVHINVPFAKPLEPARELDPASVKVPKLAAVAAPAHGAPPDAIGRALATLRRAQRPLIVSGPGPIHARDAADALRALADELDVPIVAEAGSPWWHVADVCALDALLAADTDERIRPDVVLQLGAAPVSVRWHARLAAAPPRAHLVWTETGYPDAANTASEVVTVGALGVAVELLAAAAHTIALPILRAPALAMRRVDAARATRDALADVEATDDTDPLTSRSVTRCTADAVAALANAGTPPMWVVGNSCAIRDVDLWGTAAAGNPILTQRGVAGIDGIVCGAIGSAIASEQPVVVLHGDVSAVHDLHGLVLARGVPRPFIVVVLDNGGGRIFEQLPAARHPQTRALLDRCFIADAGVDIAEVAAGFGLASATVRTVEALREALRTAQTRSGATVIRAVVDPARDAEMRLAAHAERSAALATVRAESAP